MITLFSGIPRSGKSFKMVAELSRQKDKYYVVHNIDGLQEGYLGEYGVNWIDYCTKNNIEVTDFFSKDYQIKFTTAVNDKYSRPVLVIIDEAHEWFDRHSKNLKMWLSYHGHLNQNIWLVAHRSTNLPAVYRSFIEVEYRAKGGSFIGMPGYFCYNRILGGQRSGYTFEKKDKEIFKLYKSELIESSKKRKVPMVLPTLAAIAIIGLLMFFVIPQHFMKKTKTVNAKAKKEVAEVKKDSPVISNDAVKLAVQKAAEADLESRYAYVGTMEGKVVLEDRKSGEQISMARIPGRLMMIEYSGVDYCRVISGVSGQEHYFYNSQRFVDAAGRPLRTDASTNQERINKGG